MSPFVRGFVPPMRLTDDRLLRDILAINFEGVVSQFHRLVVEEGLHTALEF